MPSSAGWLAPERRDERITIHGFDVPWQGEAQTFPRVWALLVRLRQRPSFQRFQFVLQMTYRNLVISVSYNGYDAHVRDLLAADAIALITDKAAQELVRIRSYARSHTHDRWPAWAS